jgi:hypothetical protein
VSVASVRGGGIVGSGLAAAAASEVKGAAVDAGQVVANGAIDGFNGAVDGVDGAWDKTAGARETVADGFDKSTPW